jgi:hypothetical protein
MEMLTPTAQGIALLDYAAELSLIAFSENLRIVETSKNCFISTFIFN